MVHLARTNSRSKSAHLAEELGTTPGFLTQVIAPLAAKGWVQSDPGPTGGYSATASLDDLTVLDIIEAVEGPTETGRCVLEDRECGQGMCALHQPWSAARDRLLEQLGSTSLATLAPTATGTKQ